MPARAGMVTVLDNLNATIKKSFELQNQQTAATKRYLNNILYDICQSLMS